jgi:UDP-glucose:(heptosyl)LPS alpha-1,3-glucosyltransferase
MHALLAILHADPARGGAERYTVDVASRLAAKGVNVTIAATSFAPGQTPFARLVVPAQAMTRLGTYLRFIDALDRHYDHYDVVHAMLPVRRCDLYHPHAGIAAEAVVSGHAKHGPSLLRFGAMLANRVNFKRRTFATIEHAMLTGPRPPRVACLSDYITTALVRHYRNAGSLALKLFNGTDLARFDPDQHPHARALVRQQFGLPPDAPLVLMVAQDFARKGLAPLIQAMALLPEVGAAAPHLLVVGRPNPAEYLKLAKRLGLERRITFAGPQPDTARFYAAADVFALPTRHDPCSLVVLESLVMGTPVVSTASNGACEVMRQGVHGFVLPEIDVPELARALAAALAPAKNAAMRAACLALRPALSLDHHVDTLLQMYALTRKPPS